MIQHKISFLLILLLIPLSIGMHKGIFYILENYTTLFDIQNIILEGASLPEIQILETELSKYKKTSIISVPIDDIQENLETNNFIRSADIVKHYPNTLQVIIEERKPVANIRSGKQTYTADKDGVILFMPADNLLPIISIDYGLIINGTQIEDERLTTTLPVLAQLSAADISMITIKRDKGTTFRIKNITPEFNIDQYVLSEKYINRAIAIVKSLKNNKMVIPRKIDIYSSDNSAIGYL